MSYLIDSDWVADALAGRAPAELLLERLATDGLAISLITYGEIYEGIYYGRDPKATEAGFRRFVGAVRVLPLTRLILRRFARLRGELRKQGRPIGDMDLLIAATAIEHSLALVSRNRREFARVPGLTLHEP